MLTNRESFVIGLILGVFAGAGGTILGAILAGRA